MPATFTGATLINTVAGFQIHKVTATSTIEVTEAGEALVIVVGGGAGATSGIASVNYDRDCVACRRMRSSKHEKTRVRR